MLTLWDSGFGEAAEEFGGVSGGEVRILVECFEDLTMLFRGSELNHEELCLGRLSVYWYADFGTCAISTGSKLTRAVLTD
jgi:hypothetical protein